MNANSLRPRVAPLFFCASCGSCLGRVRPRRRQEALRAHAPLCRGAQREAFLARLRSQLSVRQQSRVAEVVADVEVLGDRYKPGWCDDCQARHTREARQAVLRRLLPASPEEIKTALADGYPCLYGEIGGDTAGDRQLQRDLRAMGARYNGADWIWRTTTNAPKAARVAEAAA